MFYCKKKKTGNCNSYNSSFFMQACWWFGLWLGCALHPIFSHLWDLSWSDCERTCAKRKQRGWILWEFSHIKRKRFCAVTGWSAICSEALLQYSVKSYSYEWTLPFKKEIYGSLLHCDLCVCLCICLCVCVPVSVELPLLNWNDSGIIPYFRDSGMEWE